MMLQLLCREWRYDVVAKSLWVHLAGSNSAVTLQCYGKFQA